MSERKTPEELAAEITMAALSAASNDYVPTPEIVAKFYRAIYKEIKTCEETPLDELKD